MGWAEWAVAHVVISIQVGSDTETVHIYRFDSAAAKRLVAGRARGVGGLREVLDAERDFAHVRLKSHKSSGLLCSERETSS